MVWKVIFFDPLFNSHFHLPYTSAVKMGRKTKIQKEKALQIHCLKISPTVADAIQISPYMEKPHPEGVNGVGLSYLHSDGPPFEDGNIKTSPNGEIVSC